ncbi:MAG: glycosyltransferase family 1 protein [Patescibacteria group bacterium]|nr:glycosyltransferase family 1 protein [Patescibacteria group bacterium]
MKIAINTTSLSSASQNRGIGFYTSRLIAQLQTNPALQLIKFEKKAPSGVDLIHYPGFNPFQFSFPLINPFPFLVTIHDLIPLKFPTHFPPGIKGKLRWLIQRRLLLSSAAIITDSLSSQKDILALTEIPQKKIHVIYLAADKLFKPQKPINKFSLPNKFVLYVGDVNYNKNLPELIQTCLTNNYPLVLVGKQLVEKNYDPHHPENQALVKVQSLIQANPNKIFPLGFVPTQDLVRLYNLATVYVQPSLAEGFGLPVLEAMACGCPVLIGPADSLSEIAGPAAGEFNENNLKLYWQSPALRLKMSQLGLIQAAKFSWEKTAEETIKVYESI